MQNHKERRQREIKANFRLVIRLVSRYNCYNVRAGDQRLSIIKLYFFYTTL